MDQPRLAHVRVNVRDFARSVTWYEAVLGLNATGHWPRDVPTYAHFDTGGAQFAIAVVEPVPAAGRYNFSVVDVDAWWARLREDADIVEPLHDTPYGTRKFTIRDPDGNELGFVLDP
jgi:catechol 2,3-dioxygenase-like lactoylglutathione lyase family enzyme